MVNPALGRTTDLYILNDLIKTRGFVYSDFMFDKAKYVFLPLRQALSVLFTEDNLASSSISRCVHLSETGLLDHLFSMEI